MFVPVSGPFGTGEFARSSAIARAVAQRWPKAAIHFVLSRAAPYASDMEFPATLLASSATFHSRAVIDLIRKWHPNVVVFDNAGRTSQLKAAQRSGARVVYISARHRQRAKAFRLRWMSLIDEHWIAYPEFIAGSLRLLERLKLKMLGRPVVRYLDVIFSRAPPGRREAILSLAGCNAGGYILVVPGGGTGHPGADDAVARFLAAARQLAAGGIVTVFVGPIPPSSAQAPADSNLRPVGAIPQYELVELMRSARLIVVNGGSTLLQSIACGAACVAVPIARDQIKRIRRCVELGVAVGARLEAASIIEKATALLGNEPAREALAWRAAGLALADGVDVAAGALGNFIESNQRVP